MKQSAVFRLALLALIWGSSFLWIKLADRGFASRGHRPGAGRRGAHPPPGPENDCRRAARWGHRWSFELTSDGPDATIVTEIYDCSRVPEEERAGMDNGRIWIESMAGTLERLDRACTGQ